MLLRLMAASSVPVSMHRQQTMRNKGRLDKSKGAASKKRKE